MILKFESQQDAGKKAMETCYGVSLHQYAMEAN